MLIGKVRNTTLNIVSTVRFLRRNTKSSLEKAYNEKRKIKKEKTEMRKRIIRYYDTKRLKLLGASNVYCVSKYFLHLISSVSTLCVLSSPGIYSHFIPYF